MERSIIHKKSVDDISKIIFNAKITSTEAYGILETVKNGITSTQILKTLKELK